MKVRLGHVSNSSSSSFTLFGVAFNSEKEFKEITGTPVYEYCNEHGLAVEYGDPNCWNQKIYIGLILSGEIEHNMVSDMKDDETKQEFMDRVVRALPEEIKDEAAWHSESFYNG